MKEYRELNFSGERTLYGEKDAKLSRCVFEKGESPLKESADIELENCIFGWKYPLWYSRNIKADNCAWFEMARAGVWYTENIEVKNSMIQAPKNFRRCRDVVLKDVVLSDAKETLWNCSKVRLDNVTAKGDYFAMNCSDMEISGLKLDGNYSFDGVSDAVVRNSRLLSKDAFWNSKNITVYDSFISGEYLGWNSENLMLINCTIESLQGMCYIKNLVMKNCRLINTTLAFEYSDVDAVIDSKIESVLNPGSGTIKAERIGELIIEKDRVDPQKTVIICNDIEKRSDRPEWMR